jgi:hypothetical protein
LPFGVLAPHLGQIILSSSETTFSPHCRQNFAPAGKSAPHFAHLTDFVPALLFG